MILTRREIVALLLTAGSVTSIFGFLAMETRPVKAGTSAAGSAQDAGGQKAEADPKVGQKERDKSETNLRMIALAMHNYIGNSKETRFPPAAIRKDGKPLLSWRVALLPHLEQQALYDQFHLDEPWNSPHNKKLLNKMPDVYAPVIRTDEPRGSTYYQVFTGPGALFSRMSRAQN